MKIKMITSMCGPGIDWPKGSEPDIDDDEAVRLVRAGFGETISDTDAKKVKAAIADLEKAEADAVKSKEPAAKKAAD